jgi:hypothetical protein
VFFVAALLLRVIDDSTVSRSCVSQEEIAVGRTEMAKLWGIWEGRWA